MIKIKRILCPTDLSTESDEALRYAIALALSYGAKLFLLHFSTDKKFDKDSHSGRMKSYMSRLFSDSLAPHLALARLDDLYWEGIVRSKVEHVGQAISLEAIEQNIDLIVMRSRRRPRAAVLLGSTAETVCHSAPCPVLVTHPREREWVGKSSGEIDLNRILIAHDFSPDSEASFNYGLSLAQEYQSEVHLLHVLSSSGSEEPELAWSSAAGGGAYTYTARKLQQSLPKEAALWCSFVNVVRCGKTYEEILSYARDHEIDLICMGVSGSDWRMGKLFGSNVDRVLREAPCPILVAGSVDHRYSFLSN